MFGCVVIAAAVAALTAVVVIVDYVCEAYNNPPDFFLDVLNGSVAVTGTVTSEEKTQLSNGDS